MDCLITVKPRCFKRCPFFPFWGTLGITQYVCIWLRARMSPTVYFMVFLRMLSIAKNVLLKLPIQKINCIFKIPKISPPLFSISLMHVILLTSAQFSSFGKWPIYRFQAIFRMYSAKTNQVRQLSQKHLTKITSTF